ncbi:MAG: hypothetical protein HGA57_11085 [Chlorobium limicola]|uniref:Fic family protein n=1 Tax=Chlorobium limicola TaxID=1092 RepID=UPI0023F49F33|nr:hypothetical protein [Chlorobium limicola]NTV21897.1 hypothetical protein [Chlorobium limicola]
MSREAAIKSIHADKAGDTPSARRNPSNGRCMPFFMISARLLCATRQPFPGQLPEGITKESLAKGRISVLRNPDIAHLLYLPALKAGLIEMTIPDKPTSRMLQYRRTNKGLLLQKVKTLADRAN